MPGGIIGGIIGGFLGPDIFKGIYSGIKRLFGFKVNKDEEVEGGENVELDIEHFLDNDIRYKLSWYNYKLNSTAE